MCQVVKLLESRGNTLQLAFGLLNVFKVFEQLMSHRAYGDVVPCGAFRRDRINLGLGLFDDLFDLATGLGVTELDDARARSDKATHDRALTNDARVVTSVRRSRHRSDEGMQVGGATDPGQSAFALQIPCNSDRVGGFVLTEEVHDRIEDDLVIRHVEVGTANLLCDSNDRISGEHHRSEDRHFRVDVLWWCAIKIFRHDDPLYSRRTRECGSPP